MLNVLRSAWKDDRIAFPNIVYNLKKKLKSFFFEDNDNKPTLTDFRALTSPTPHSLSLRFVGLVNILDTRQNYLKTYI